MNANPVYAEVPSKRSAVLSNMIRNEVSSEPVVRKDRGTLVGIVSIKELMSRSETDQTALIMNPRPPRVKPKDEVQKVAKAMIRSGFRAIPVIDDSSRLIGIVSVEDLLEKIDDSELLRMPVDELLSKTFASAWSETPMPVAYKIMDHSGYDTITLIDSQGNINSYLTQIDFLKELEEEYSSSKAQMQASSESEDWDWSVSPVLYVGMKGMTLPNKKISELSPRKLPVVPSGTTVEAAISEALRDRAPQVAVKENGEVIGMLYDLSIIEQLLNP